MREKNAIVNCLGRFWQSTVFDASFQNIRKTDVLKKVIHLPLRAMELAKQVKQM